MSFITDLQTVYKNIKPNGTFNFTSEARQDNYLINIASTNYPVMLIDDEVTNDALLKTGANWHDNFNLRLYFLTKFDVSGNKIEFDETRINQESKLVEPMRVLAANTIARYLREYPIYVVRSGEDVRVRMTDQYDVWTQGLCGVMVNIQITNRRTLNYCTITP